MLDLSKIETVVCHDFCPDGMASAILVKDAFYDRPVNIVFLQHGTEAHRSYQPRPNTMFVDMVPYVEMKDEVITSAGERVLESWLDVGAIILDHHKTAMPILERFGANARGTPGPGICGATLAYDFVWRPLRNDLAIQDVFATRFAYLAGVRDTWQKKSPDWIEACGQAEILTFFPQERWLAMSLTEISFRWKKDFYPIGEVLLEKHARAVERTIKGSFRYTTKKGTKVAIFESTRMSSDTAEKMDDVDFVVGFRITNEDGFPKLIMSTRSCSAYDVGALCEYFEGGGHTKSAGCNRSLLEDSLHPFAMIPKLIEEFEGSSDTAPKA